MVSFLAIMAGTGLGFSENTLPEMVKFGLGLALVLSVGRFIQFLIQEWEWMCGQIYVKGIKGIAKGMPIMLLIHVGWYAVLVGVSAGAVHLIFR